jgi:diacylglycerol kinase family enzyme
MKQALIIFNPTAGIMAKTDVKTQIKNKLIDLKYQPVFLILDENFEKNIAGMDLTNVKLVVAVGGDGTVKVAAREIISRQINAPLAVIPFGSANVLASTLRLPMTINEALSLLTNYSLKKIDVGVVNREKYFLVGFSLGYVSSIIIDTERSLKNKFGSVGYLLKLLWNKIKIPRIKFRIETQNHTFWIKGNSLIIFNAFNFYGFQPKKEISISDGIFNLYVVTNKTFWAMIEAAVGVLLYSKPPKHIFALDNKYFKIKVKRRRFLKTAQIDGDRIKVSNTIEVEVLPKALTVLVKKLN